MTETCGHLPEGKPLEFQRSRGSESSQLKIICGPLLRYWNTDNNGVWTGSVMYVTEDHCSNYTDFPDFILKFPSSGNLETVEKFHLATLFGCSLWRYDLKIQLDQPQQAEYTLGIEHDPFQISLPARDGEMKVLFSSCNGFSLATETNSFPANLWKDVLRQQSEQEPYHVMLGGGDQIYCDNVKLFLPVLQKWTDKNFSIKKFWFKPSEKDEEGLRAFYFQSYVNWFGRGYWKGLNGEIQSMTMPDALAQIPMLNIYDDHDVIDGWGSYNDTTMRSPVFALLGKCAHEAYLLFQQFINPGNTKDSKVHDDSWITGRQNGPFLPFPPRSISSRVGKSAHFLGLDCRTERSSHQIVSKEHYKQVFDSLRQTLKSNDIKHLYLMLGVPIAYPRMNFAERLMSSGLVVPLKFLARHGIALKGFVNEFDGQVELLDDLNDHWCADNHKRERNWFMYQLQELAQETSTRITILSGDVHLCGMGLFQSKLGAKEHKSLFRTAPKSKSLLAVENDHRYMLCPISSAICNAPPPQLLADFMNKRNKMHYINDTVETMVKIFDHDVDKVTKLNNNTTLARRNYCTLAATTKELKVTLQVEINQTDLEARTTPYTETVPSLHVL